MLSARNLSCQRGRRLLFSGLGFDLAPGQALELAGPNGSGKTSLLRMLAGLRSCESGRIAWQDRDVRQLGGRYREQLAYLAHEPALKLELTLLENLHFGAAIAGDDTSGLDTALRRAGLNNRKHVLAGRLSAGQRQRAALARLLLGKRALWLLDEPWAHLDARGRELVQAILGAHLHAGGLLVYTSHHGIDLAGAPLQRLDLGA